MDYRSLLLNFPSGDEKNVLIRDVGKSHKKFNILLDLALNDKEPVSWRAGWILDGCDEENPGLASPSISRIIKSLPTLDSKGTLRCMVRLLSRHEIEEDDQGLLIDLCFSYLVSELFPVAVKVHAMQIIYNHVLIYPELKQELITVISDQVSNNSVGFKSRGMRLIKQLESSL